GYPPGAGPSASATPAAARLSRERRRARHRPVAAPALVALALVTLMGCADQIEAPGGQGNDVLAAPRAEVPVTSVVDGDTIHVLRRGRDVKVRLIGIDAPEVS
ncbi:MAG: thermonuclease family protein, partial [Acidimicrobiales bacterium]